MAVQLEEGNPVYARHRKAKNTTLTVVALLMIFLADASAAEPPVNPHLAQSSWPIYHANSYATASTLSTVVADPVAFETVLNLPHRRFRGGQVSPWTVLRPPTPDGRQVVLTTPVNGVAKYVVEAGHLHGSDFIALDRNWMDFDWNILLLADGSAVVTEKKHNRFAVVGESGKGVDSQLQIQRRLPVDAGKYGKLTSNFTLAYEGSIIALTDKPALIAVNAQDGRVLDTMPLPDGTGGVSHNTFPIDERGRAYLLGQRKFIAVDWDGKAFKIAWTAPYNMRGPGFEHVAERPHLLDVLDVARGEPGTGSGTTPTLIGNSQTGVVVVVDGHSPKNNLVAFWRKEIPEDWRPLPDPSNPAVKLDLRVAGVFSLPYSTPEGDGHSAENSPAVLGNAIVVAQWAGFTPGGTPPRGVQRVDWDPEQRKFRLVWANPDVHINGVPTIGRGKESPCVFGMGREGDRYIYSVLNLSDGKRMRRIDLGASDDVLDQGNNHAIAADGSIIYGGKKKIVRLYGP